MEPPLKIAIFTPLSSIRCDRNARKSIRLLDIFDRFSTPFPRPAAFQPGQNGRFRPTAILGPRTPDFSDLPNPPKPRFFADSTKGLLVCPEQSLTAFYGRRLNNGRLSGLPDVCYKSSGLPVGRHKVQRHAGSEGGEGPGGHHAAREARLRVPAVCRNTENTRQYSLRRTENTLEGLTSFEQNNREQTGGPLPPGPRTLPPGVTGDRWARHTGA